MTCVGWVTSFSFRFCTDGSVQLMRQTFCYCIILYIFFCAVLAAAYLKYCWCCLQCLPFVWYFFFHCETHTHTHARTACPNEKCNFWGRSLWADLLLHLFSIRWKCSSIRGPSLKKRKKKRKNDINKQNSWLMINATGFQRNFWAKVHQCPVRLTCNTQE